MQDLHYNRSTFSKNLCRLMESHHMSAAELSRLVGVSPSTVSEWKKGKKAPRWNKLEQIAALFHVPKSELIEEIQTDFLWFQDEPFINFSVEGEDLLRLNDDEIIDLCQNLREHGLREEDFFRARDRALKENALQNNSHFVKEQEETELETEIRSTFADERILWVLEAMGENPQMQELIYLFLELSGDEQQSLLELVHLYVDQLKRRQHNK